LVEPLFADVVGQRLAVQLLTAALQQQRLAPAYLFCGPEGVGRSLVAMRFIEAICGGGLAGDDHLRRRLREGNHPDLLLVEPTYTEKGERLTVSQAKQAGLQKKALPQVRLEQIRELTAFLGRPPLEAPRAVVLLDGAEWMAEAAANALLKTLEEPELGLLVLLSAAPERLLSTIHSRCQRIPFSPLQPEQLQAVLGEGPADAGELHELAAGSPGALLEWRRRWQELPSVLLDQLQQQPESPLQALGLARDLSEALNTEQQLWLLQWWQLKLWRSGASAACIARLEQLRRQLQGHVQPRLAWEVALLDLLSAAA
jgi:DNA polymerase-3 subunit delta'